MTQTYTRGRFAKLNGVTLFTLRLYDRMGILKPAITDENGYHLYSEDQSQQLLFIDLCIKSGFSLKEIKALQSEIRDPAEMLTLLHGIRQRIHQKQVEFSSCEKMIESMIYYHEASAMQELDRISMKEGIHYQGLVSGRANYFLHRNAEYGHKFIRDSEERLGHPIEFPLSFLLDPQKVELSQMRMILRTNEILPGDDFYDSGPVEFHCIQAFQCDLDGVQKKVQAFLDALRRDYEPAGELLLTPVQNYLFHRTEETSVYVVGVPVRVRQG